MSLYPIEYDAPDNDKLIGANIGKPIERQVFVYAVSVYDELCKENPCHKHTYANHYTRRYI